MSPPLPGRKAYSRGAYAAWERRAKGQKDQNIVRGSAVAVRRSSTPPTTRWGRRRSRLTVARIQPGPAIDAPGSAADALCLSWCRGRPCGPGPRPEAASTDLQTQTREMTDPPPLPKRIEIPLIVRSQTRKALRVRRWMDRVRLSVCLFNSSSLHGPRVREHRELLEAS